MPEFTFSFPVEHRKEKARQEFSSYALIANIAGLTAATLHYNISLDNCYSSLKNIQLLLLFRTKYLIQFLTS